VLKEDDVVAAPVGIEPAPSRVTWIGLISVARAMIGALEEDKGDVGGEGLGLADGVGLGIGRLKAGIEAFAGSVDELADAERVAGVVDVQLPAQAAAEVLHLHGNLRHLLGELVAHQAVRLVL
jgi:hypothetical protein